MTSTEHMDESYCDLPLVCYSSPLCLPDFGKGLGACQIIPVSEGSSHTALFCNGPISSRLIKILSSKFPGGSDSKESACSVGDGGSIPGLGRDPGEGNGHLLQYCCLENPRDRGACRLQSMRSQRVRHDWATNTHSKVQFKSHFFYKHVLRTPLRRPALFFVPHKCAICVIILWFLVLLF